MKVLLVDDNEINLEIQKMMLESCGLEVITADNGRMAVDIFQEYDFFMVFMDIHMPEMDGYTACGIIREKNTSVPVIALSADVPRDEKRFKHSGMTGFLTKPIQIDSLKELLKKYTDSDIDYKVEDSSDVIFDYSSLIEVMRDEKSAFKLIKQFLSIHSKDCEQLIEMTKQGNFIGAREILHNVTGISGNMFCKRLYGISCTLRNELKDERCESIMEFADIWNETCQMLKEYHDRLAEKYPSYEHTSDWQTLWNSFISLAYDFDISAVDIFTEKTQSFMANMSSDDFRKLKNAVLNYDFLWISDNF